MKSSPNKESGSVTLGRYVLMQNLAQGGMSEVFLAKERDAGPDEPPLIIKCILPELAKNRQFLAMFINEAQLAAQINHPNIAKVLDFGEQEGRLFMAMEYVYGLDCWRFLRRLYPWGDDHPYLAVWVACRVLDALEHVHGLTDVNGNPLHVVHRDMSPTNIYLSVNGEVKLGDFGIAMIDSERYRQIKVIPKGKFGYIAPEQVDGRQIDSRADIFSVGIVLAEILIGRRMFSGHSQLSILQEIREARLEELEQNVDRVEPRLLAILRKSLAREPANRYGSAREFREELIKYLEDCGKTPNADDLGTQVRRAMELTDPMMSAPGDALRATPVTRDDRSLMPITNPGQTLRSSLLEGDHVDESTPVMLESIAAAVSSVQYTAKLADGRSIGPASYSHILELIYSDQIGPDTMISADGEGYAPVRNRIELARHLPAYGPTAAARRSHPPDRRGLINMETPVEVMLSLGLRSETGLFICQDGNRRKEVYFRKGQPVYVASNEPSELLGEYLVSRGAIERSELDLALTLLPKFKGHLGDTLIALGMLSAFELFQHIGEQIRARFVGLLRWDRGRYEFYKGAPYRTEVLEVPMDLFEICREEMLKRSEKAPISRTVFKMGGSTISPSASAEELLRRLDLPADLRDTVASLNAPKKLADWLASQENSKTKEHLIRALYVALETGIWGVDGAAPPWHSDAMEETAKLTLTRS